MRGYVSAYDAETGGLVWRTHTVPGNPADGLENDAMQRAAETWNGEWWLAGGGGTVWDAIVFDPELNLVYVGTGNADPWYRDLRGRGGDNLYACSILALHADTGEYAWHFQLVPGDHWDYDATQPLMLADLEIDGRQRRVIMQASKNAFFYVLDAATGEFLSGTPYAQMTWAAGIDPETGRPIEAAAAYEGMEPVIVTPDPGGAHNWYPMAFHPTTGLVYVPVKDGMFFIHPPDPEWQPGKRAFNAGIEPAYDGPLLEQLLLQPPAQGCLGLGQVSHALMHGGRGHMTTQVRFIVLENLVRERERLGELVSLEVHLEQQQSRGRTHQRIVLEQKHLPGAGEISHVAIDPTQEDAGVFVLGIQLHGATRMP